MQVEAGIQRQTEVEVSAVAIGDVAAVSARFQTGEWATVQGFLTGRRRMGTQQGTQLVLHVTHIMQGTNIQQSD